MHNNKETPMPALKEVWSMAFKTWAVGAVLLCGCNLPQLTSERLYGKTSDAQTVEVPQWDPMDASDVEVARPDTALEAAPDPGGPLAHEGTLTGHVVDKCTGQAVVA